jgi:hypothetical protein
MLRCGDAMMRTTIDLPADLYDLARQLAHANDQSMSEVVVALTRAGLHRERVVLLPASR